MGLQKIHEHEALGGGHGRRLYCRLTSLSRSLQTILRIILDSTVRFADEVQAIRGQDLALVSLLAQPQVLVILFLRYCWHTYSPQALFGNARIIQSYYAETLLS